MGRRRKPHDPAALQRAAAERAARDAEVKRLRESGAEVTTDRGGRVLSARRSNVFNLLLKRGTITQGHHNAAYTLALDWAAWRGMEGEPEVSPGRIDRCPGSKALVTDRMIAAGDKVASALAAVSERLMLEAFMVATVEHDRPMAWRGIVERTAGVTVRERQTVAVVGMLEELREHYEAPKAQHRVAA
jgi:hypothetical protein